MHVFYSFLYSHKQDSFNSFTKYFVSLGDVECVEAELVNQINISLNFVRVGLKKVTGIFH